MKLKILDKEIEVKFTFRANVTYEYAHGETFMADTTEHFIEYFYYSVMAVLGDGAMSFKDFYDFINENPWYYYEFVEEWTHTMTNINEMREKAKKEAEGQVTGKESKARKPKK